MLKSGHLSRQDFLSMVDAVLVEVQTHDSSEIKYWFRCLDKRGAGKLTGGRPFLFIELQSISMVKFDVFC